LSRGMVPSLFSICVNFLVDNFECVEALGDVESSIRRTICSELIAKNKLNGDAFQAIAEPGIEALELVDCAEVTQDQLSHALKALVPAGLRYLLLHHAGRCFGSTAIKSLTSMNDAKLFALSIGGAYLLKDQDAVSLIQSLAGSLTSLEFKACPLLNGGYCRALQENYSSSGTGTLVELSMENLTLAKDDLLLFASDALRHLRSLALRSMESVDDEVVCKFLDNVEELEGIELSFNHNISDDSLSAIRSCNGKGKLRSLQLCNLKSLTEVGLETLFTFDIEGLPSPPRLSKLNLSGCAHDAITDNIVELACTASSMKKGATSVPSRHSSLGGLVHVNVSGSSCTDYSMESLAAASAGTLEELNVSFSPKITDKGLGYLVSKASHQFTRIHVWGCAQITDEFLDGHSRCEDSTFEIVGTWMKKSM